MINKNPCINIYENRKKNSKLSSQILYGEKFSIIKKYKDFYKIKTDYDKYVGFISHYPKSFIFLMHSWKDVSYVCLWLHAAHFNI